MKCVTVMVMSSILKNCSFFFLRGTFYNSIYKCILQNMKRVKVMHVYFLKSCTNLLHRTFAICFINNQGKKS